MIVDAPSQESLVSMELVTGFQILIICGSDYQTYVTNYVYKLELQCVTDILIASYIRRKTTSLVARVPGYRTEMYCVSCEVRNEFIYVM
jgi:hypothetical protein